jgi:hypothetical protein
MGANLVHIRPSARPPQPWQGPAKLFNVNMRPKARTKFTAMALISPTQHFTIVD